MNDDGTSDVAELVARCVARLPEAGADVVDEVCAERPELAAPVRERLALLASMGLLHEPSEADDAAPRPRRLGPFTLGPRLGGGGMGEVYLARQDDLGRDVALKLVRPDQLHFDGARERFRREAEAVARLKHPGIVPVYTVGEAEGVPYLAMECVEGATLDEVLESVAGCDPASLSGRDLERAVVAAVERLDEVRGRPPGVRDGASTARRRASPLFTGSWVEVVLRVGVAVCDALQHAHDAGVLHRDVKPSNLMVTLDGRVLLLDFGLARRVGGERITRTGAVLGSLAYMPPEQVRGEVDGVDGRVDVYALGATLYELLALHAPYRAPTPDALREAILAGGAPSVRQANPSVGRDAATLLRVALGVRASDRYATPADMADDVRRVLARRPLEARPPSVAVRALRWVQRRPALAASIALGALLVIGGPLAYAALAQRHADAMSLAADEARREARRADAQADVARAARHESERHFHLAHDAIDGLLVDVVWDELYDQPRLLDVRRQLLEKALASYDVLVAARPDDEVLRVARLDVLSDVGSVQRETRRLDDAARSFAALSDGVDAERARVTSPEGVRRLDELRYEATIGMSLLNELEGRLALADQFRRDAIAQLEAYLERHPDDFDRRRSLGRVRGSHARRVAATGRVDDALAQFERAVDELDAVLDARPDDDVASAERLGVLDEWISALFAAERHEDCLRLGLEIAPELAALGADDALLVQERAYRSSIRSIMAGSLVALGAPDDAAPLADAACAESAALVADHGDRHWLHVVDLNARVRRFEVAYARGDGEAARDVLAAALASLDGALARWPDATELLRARALLLSERSRTHRELLDDVASARADLDAALVAHEPLRDAVEPRMWGLDMRSLQNSLCFVARDQGDHATSVAAAEAMVRHDPIDDPEFALDAAWYVLRCLPIAAADGALAEHERATVDADYRARAYALLDEAVRRGADGLGAPSRWTAIADDPRFERLRARLGAP